jgi:glutathione-regulated potassium-efflux system ancillary protein KefG
MSPEKTDRNMNRILILFTHPRFEKSRTNRALLSRIGGMPGVTVNDLYEKYPDFNIDVDEEKALMIDHRIIVWHHPFYMYGAPALLKQWIDLVFEYGWAHGRGGVFLKDKLIFNTLTSGGTREAYSQEGFNRFTIREFLRPFQQAAGRCNMIYLPPFVVQGTHLLSDDELARHADDYRSLLERLIAGEFDLETIKRFRFLNDWLSLVSGVRKP